MQRETKLNKGIKPMRNILKNHSEVAHFWANKIQPSGKACNMFYNKDIIYSYGYHFPIAKHINNNLILFTSKGYSISTSKHLGITRSAIPSEIEVLTVPFIEVYNDRSNKGLHIDNIKYFINQIRENFNKSERARKYKEMYLRNGLANINNMKRYLELFRVKSKLPNNLKKAVNMFLNMDNTEIMEVIKAEQDIQKKAELQRKKEQEKKFLELLPKWKNNEVYNLPYHNRQYLRLVNDEIETSLHTKISIDTFQKYYAMLKSGKSLVNEKIDYYRVTKQDSNLLTIGCHVIPVSEINYIANLLK
tara:strand:- start:926 stop:1837 length:912 start_codon:yes stop_codon:yes gene_type:complete